MADSESSPGAGLGAYEILGQLGQGGMASAYVALRRGPGGVEQRVCLKRIRAEHDQDPEFVRQFMAEAKIAASMSHANLVKLLDFGRDADGHFLALELVQGMDLWALFSKLAARGERLEPGFVAYIAIELATALEVLHRPSPDGSHAGLVHRDVSPSNVLISYDGEVKLADFGIARPVDGLKHTTTGVIKGKVPYMAPRYARTAQADARCDLFAVGVVLFELLAGRRPYQGQTDLITLELAAKGDHPPLGALAPNAPPALVAAAERLLEPEPELGYQNATELLNDLTALPLAGATLRRQLGQLVEQLRPQKASVFGARPSQPPPAVQAATQTLPDATAMIASGPADPTLRAGVPDVSVQRAATGAQSANAPNAHRWLLTGAAAFLIGAVTLYATRTDDVPKPPAHNPTAEAIDTPTAQPIVTAEPSPVVRGVAEPQAEGATPTEDATDTAALRRATLTVVVMPFGEVIIDGRSRGQAPVTVKLAAGRHEITTVRQGVHSTQRVELSAGESRRLLLK